MVGTILVIEIFWITGYRCVWLEYDFALFCHVFSSPLGIKTNVNLNTHFPLTLQNAFKKKTMTIF